MRRSTVITIGIMLTAFGAMFAAAGSALQPLAQDAEAGKLLTSLLVMRGDIVETSKARVSRVPGGEGRLAMEGRGLLIRLEPSDPVRARVGGLQALALRAAHECRQRFSGLRVDWIEIVMVVGGKAGEIRTLLGIDPDGGLGAPRPTLPKRLPPSA